MSSAPPLPDTEARVVSDALLEKLEARIQQQNGCLPFDEFMASALYEPGLGYYSNGLMPFGEQGDFVTAPESGSLFAACLARSVASVLQQVDQGVVMELGAGSGVLAADLLGELQQLDVLPGRYCILEPSAAMRALQEDTLTSRAPALKDRVEWLDALPEKAVSGVVFGNEVADALPVKRFLWQSGEVRELGVAWSKGQLSMCERSPDKAVEDLVLGLAHTFGWVSDYQSEFCPALPAWINSLADCLRRGALLLIDYGYGRNEYYHPQRSMGTLMCHYRHHAHDNALWYPGIQDITAFVDFTAIAEAATESGMHLEGFNSQAQFLVACDIDKLIARGDPNDTRRFLQLTNEAKRLLLPSEMGERFKCIGFSRDLDESVVGFAPGDLRSRL